MCGQENGQQVGERTEVNTRRNAKGKRPGSPMVVEVTENDDSCCGKDHCERSALES